MRSKGIIDGLSVTVEDGVVFFADPPLTTVAHFVCSHLQCDFIIKRDESPGSEWDSAYIIVFPLNHDNKVLRRVFNSRGMRGLVYKVVIDLGDDGICID